MRIKIEDLENLTILTDEEASQINGGYYAENSKITPEMITAIVDAGIKIIRLIQCLLSKSKC